jgi:hypothetical protein
MPCGCWPTRFRVEKMRVSYLYEAKLRLTNSAIECQESQAWDLKNMNRRDPEHRILPEKTKGSFDSNSGDKISRNRDGVFVL